MIHKTTYANKLKLPHSISKSSEIVIVFARILKSMFKFQSMTVCQSINWKMVFKLWHTRVQTKRRKKPWNTWFSFRSLFCSTFWFVGFFWNSVGLFNDSCYDIFFLQFWCDFEVDSLSIIFQFFHRETFLANNKKSKITKQVSKPHFNCFSK